MRKRFAFEPGDLEAVIRNTVGRLIRSTPLIGGAWWWKLQLDSAGCLFAKRVRALMAWLPPYPQDLVAATRSRHYGEAA
jgi:hypothetical protein